MTTEQIYHELNGDVDSRHARQLLKEYFLEQVSRYDKGDETPELLAYEIAGLMSTQAFEGVADDYPLVNVTAMAGQLELPSHHRSSTATWDELKRLISQLD